MAGGAVPMDIGQAEWENGGHEERDEEPQSWDIDALGGACYLCNRTGRYARNCPTKGKGKGKRMEDNRGREWAGVGMS